LSICQCECCAPDNPAPTYTRVFALSCEARAVLAMPLSARREYLNKINQYRRTDLEAAMRSAWTAAKTPHPG
jgi:hypothetical protein